MDLVERYLQAIGQYLPEPTRADTLAELRANLLAEMDDRAEVLGRPLVEAEVAAILKTHGKPEVVALRYLPQRSLIGPTIFPFYALTMGRVLSLVVFLSFLAKGIEFVTGQDRSMVHALVGFALGLATSLLITAALITAIFAGIEWSRERGKLGHWNKWDPAKLPAVKKHDAPDVSPKAMWKRVLDLMIHCLWMAYVLWVPWHPYWILGPGVYYLDKLDVALAPVWHTFYALLVVLLVVQLGMKLLAFLPAMEDKLVPLKLASDLLGLVAIGILALHSTYFVAANAGADLHRIAALNHSVNLGFQILLALSVFGLAQQVWKYRKRSTPMRQWAF